MSIWKINCPLTLFGSFIAQSYQLFWLYISNGSVISCISLIIVVLYWQQQRLFGGYRRVKCPQVLLNWQMLAKIRSPNTKYTILL